MIEKIIKENIIKNTIIIILLIAFYFSIQTFFGESNGGGVNDKTSLGSFVVVISIIAVTACFGNFAFTYEKINQNDIFQKYLAHFTTALLLLIIGISLIFLKFSTDILIGNFIVINFTLILLYFACIMYDFWDLLRIFNK